MSANFYYFVVIRRWKFILATIFPIFFLDCQSVERVDYVKPLPPQRKQASEVIIGYDLPQQKYQLLSEVTIQYSAGYRREEIIERLRRMAAESGADGILLIQMGTSRSEFMLQGGMPGSRLDSDGYRLRVQFYRLEN